MKKVVHQLDIVEDSVRSIEKSFYGARDTFKFNRKI